MWQSREELDRVRARPEVVDDERPRDGAGGHARASRPARPTAASAALARCGRATRRPPTTSTPGGDVTRQDGGRHALEREDDLGGRAGHHGERLRTRSGSPIRRPLSVCEPTAIGICAGRRRERLAVQFELRVDRRQVEDDLPDGRLPDVLEERRDPLRHLSGERVAGRQPQQRRGNRRSRRRRSRAGTACARAARRPSAAGRAATGSFAASGSSEAISGSSVAIAGS